MKRARLDFVIVGAQRSASTYLTDVLRSHPAVHMPAIEIPFFEMPFFGQDNQDVLARYLRSGESKTVGIKRPEYLGLPGVATNIASLYPEARIVAVLRDPVARLISAAHWYMYVKAIEVEPIDAVVERLQLMGDAWRDEAYAWDRYAQLIRFSAYSEGLASYRRAFGADAVKIVFQDYLRPPHFEPAVKGVFKHIGVAEISVDHDLRARSNSVIYDQRRLRFLSRRPSTFAWENEAEFRYFRTRWTQYPTRVARSASFQLVDRLLLKRIWQVSAPEITPASLAWLRELFRDDVQALAEQVDLPRAWCREYGMEMGA